MFKLLNDAIANKRAEIKLKYAEIENYNKYVYYGNLLYIILSSLDVTYLDRNCESSDIVDKYLPNSTNTYIYSLRLSRDMSDNERMGLKNAIIRGFCNELGVKESVFRDTTKVRVVNNEVIVMCRARH